jgi:hypothetical protein
LQSQFDSSDKFHIHIIQKKDAVSFLENGKNVRKFSSTGGAAIPPPPQGQPFGLSLPLVGMGVSSPQNQ